MFNLCLLKIHIVLQKTSLLLLMLLIVGHLSLTLLTHQTQLWHHPEYSSIQKYWLVKILFLFKINIY